MGIRGGYSVRKVVFAFLIFALGSVSAAMAQTTRPEVGQPQQFLFEDTLADPTEALDFTADDSSSIVTKQVTDSLLSLPASFVPKVSMELLADRLSCIEGKIPLTLNPKVAGFIDYFTVRNRAYTKMVLERKDFYFPIFEKYLKMYDLPEELKYLAIVESGLNFTAISRVGAVGLWQFMPPTGKEVGLNIDHYFDERLHVEKSTEAACKYLKRLYRVLGNWELVLASYNCGMGKVKRTVERTGKRTFWEVYPYLPQETRAYVPQFVALTYAINYYKEHNIFPDADSLLVPIPSDSVLVDKHISLPAFAQYIGVSHKDLKQINPTLRRHSTPPGQPYYLKYPSAVKDFVGLNVQELLDSAAVPVPDHYLAAYLLKADKRNKHKVLLASNAKSKRGKRGRRQPEQTQDNAKLLAIAKAAPSNQTAPVTTSASQEVVSYGSQTDVAPKSAAPDTSTEPELPAAVRASLGATTMGVTSANADHDVTAELDNQSLTPEIKKYKVAAGQGLFTIARKFGVTIEQLCAWNNIKLGATIVPGQELLVCSPDNATSGGALADVNTGMTKALAHQGPKAGSKAVGRKQSPKVRQRTYQVQPGDTLWAICQKHEGISVNDIIKLNGLKNRKLTPGQKLILG